MKILINTISTKKHSGGAFQISYNFLLKTLEDKDVEWYYLTSKDLDDVLGKMFASLKGIRYFVFPTQPNFKTYYKVKKAIHLLEEQINPDIIYSVTAPSYFTFKTKEVMRFTNPLVTHPNKYSWSILTIKQKIKTILYCWNQRRLIRKVHYFITQTETAKEGILRITKEPKDHVKVISNVLPVVFENINNTPVVVDDDWINIACIGNPVPHKNFDIVPDVLLELNRLNISNVRFFMTIPDNHPVKNLIFSKLKKYGLDDHVKNYGRVAQKDLSEMYRLCQFCFLPTLLEVFSVSTLEAMYFELPIVASNFQFNKEVLADSCLYFEPTNPNDAAKQIAKLISDKSLQFEFLEKMKKRIAVYDDYDTHFNSIKNFLINSSKE